MQESYKNTLLFLSPRESVQLFTSLRSHHPLPANDKYNWIVITDSDISDRIKGLLSNYTQSGKGCNTKSMFLLVPESNLSTKEFNRYFEHEVSNFGANSVHPLISSFSKQFLSDNPEDEETASNEDVDSTPGSDLARNKTMKSAKQKKLIIHSSEGLSTTIKAVWSMAMSLRNAEKEYCNAFMSRTECLESLKIIGLKNTILNQTKNLNEKISSSGIQSLEEFNLRFDPQNILASNKYNLKIITSSCKVLDAGYFTEDAGLVVDDEVMNSLKLESSNVNSVTNVRPGVVYYTFRNQTNVRAPVEPIPTSTPSFRNGDSPSSESNEKSFSINPYLRSPSTEMEESSESVTPSETPSMNEVPNGKNYQSTTTEAARPVNLERPIQMTSTPANVTQLYGGRGSAGSGSVAHVSHFSRSGNKIDLTKPKNSTGSERQQRSDGASGIRRKSPMKNLNPNNHHQTASLTSWLGRSWALTILITSIIGTLLTLYTFTFLLMKSCEGALGRSNRQAIASLHLFAIICLFIGALLYVFEPTPFSCTLRASIHNLTLSLLFGTLLLRAMYLRAAKWIGLGGQISSANQFLTLSFIIGVQIALEAQTWKYLGPWSNIVTANLPTFCRPDSGEYLYSQAYLIVIFFLLLIFSWTSRHQPFTSNEGSHLFTATALMAPIYITSLILSIHYLEEGKSSSKSSVTNNLSLPSMSIDSSSSSSSASSSNTFMSSSLNQYLNEERSNASSRDVIAAMTMIFTGFVTLISIFVPILYAIHKHGILMPSKAAASYTDSLSTAFTMFRNGANPINAAFATNAGAPGLATAANYHNFSNSTHHDHRPILDPRDSISSSGSSGSNSANNSSSSFLNGSPVNGVTHVKSGLTKSSNHNHHKNKVGKKRRTAGKSFFSSKANSSNVRREASSAGLIFSPATNSYSYSCTSPKCNFILAPRQHAPPPPLTHHNAHLPSVSNRISALNAVQSHPSGHGPNSQALFTSRQASYAVGPSSHHINSHLHPVSSRFSSSHQFSFPSSSKRLDDRSLGSTAVGSNRLNPIFDTHEGTPFRSAYP